MPPEYRPRPDDHLVEPLLEGLAARGERARKEPAVRRTLVLAVLGLVAALWWFAR